MSGREKSVTADRDRPTGTVSTNDTRSSSEAPTQMVRSNNSSSSIFDCNLLLSNHQGDHMNADEESDVLGVAGDDLEPDLVEENVDAQNSWCPDLLEESIVVNGIRIWRDAPTFLPVNQHEGQAIEGFPTDKDVVYGGGSDLHGNRRYESIIDYLRLRNSYPSLDDENTVEEARRIVNGLLIEYSRFLERYGETHYHIGVDRVVSDTASALAGGPLPTSYVPPTPGQMLQQHYHRQRIGGGFDFGDDSGDEDSRYDSNLGGQGRFGRKKPQSVDINPEMSHADRPKKSHCTDEDLRLLRRDREFDVPGLCQVMSSMDINDYSSQLRASTIDRPELMSIGDRAFFFSPTVAQAHGDLIDLHIQANHRGLPEHHNSIKGVYLAGSMSLSVSYEYMLKSIVEEAKKYEKKIYKFGKIVARRAVIDEENKARAARFAKLKDLPDLPSEPKMNLPITGYIISTFGNIVKERAERAFVLGDNIGPARDCFEMLLNSSGGSSAQPDEWCPGDYVINLESTGTRINSMSVSAINSDGTNVPMMEHLLRDLRHTVLHDSEEVEIASVYIDKQSYLVVPVGADLAPEVEDVKKKSSSSTKDGSKSGAVDGTSGARSVSSATTKKKSTKKKKKKSTSSSKDGARSGSTGTVDGTSGARNASSAKKKSSSSNGGASTVDGTIGAKKRGASRAKKKSAGDGTSGTSSAKKMSSSSKIPSVDYVSDSSNVVVSATNVSDWTIGSSPTRIYCFETSFRNIWPSDDHEMTTTMDYNSSISLSKFSTWDEQFDLSRYGKNFGTHTSMSNPMEFVYFAEFFLNGPNGVECLPIERAKSCAKKMGSKAFGNLSDSEAVDAVACKISNPSLPNEYFLKRFRITKNIWEKYSAPSGGGMRAKIEQIQKMEKLAFLHEFNNKDRYSQNAPNRIFTIAKECRVKSGIRLVKEHFIRQLVAGKGPDKLDTSLLMRQGQWTPIAMANTLSSGKDADLISVALEELNGDFVTDSANGYVRTGKLEGGKMKLVTGEEVVIVTDPDGEIVGDSHVAMVGDALQKKLTMPCAYAGFSHFAMVGDVICFGDDDVLLTVSRVGKNIVCAMVNRAKRSVEEGEMMVVRRSGSITGVPILPHKIRLSTFRDDLLGLFQNRQANFLRGVFNALSFTCFGIGSSCVNQKTGAFEWNTGSFIADLDHFSEPNLWDLLDEPNHDFLEGQSLEQIESRLFSLSRTKKSFDLSQFVCLSTFGLTNNDQRSLSFTIPEVLGEMIVGFPMLSMYNTRKQNFWKVKCARANNEEEIRLLFCEWMNFKNKYVADPRCRAWTETLGRLIELTSKKPYFTGHEPLGYVPKQNIFEFYEAEHFVREAAMIAGNATMDEWVPYELREDEHL